MRRLIVVLSLAIAGATIHGQNLSFGSREARRVPDWLPRSTIYELWLNAFSKEGTLRGATAGLQHISELGTNIIVYLGPIAKKSTVPHASPYNIADYNAIDPQYGTEQDLHDFVAAAHKRGLKVMLDIIYYHTAPDSVLLHMPDALVKTPDGKLARGFWPQPLPDFRNPEVRRFLIASLVHWVRDFAIDGFRCDVGGGVPVAFWEEARKELDRVNPDVVLLSESDRPDDQLQAFDINYNFEHYLALRSVLRDGAPAIHVRETWQNMHDTFPRGARLLHFSDNHDWRRAVLEFGEEGAMAASILNFTLDGIPFLYNGQEIGDRTATHWSTPGPIQWSLHNTAGDEQILEATLARHRRLYDMRARYKALTSGEVIWIGNTEPASVLSFLRRKDDEEIVVILNLSNRALHVTVDLPVMDYYALESLIKDEDTRFKLYSGRVATDLAAFDFVVGRKRPLQPLKEK